MKIINNLETKKLPNYGICAIGNFDGIHLGHQLIFKKLVEESEKLKIPSIALTFFPHPLKILYPNSEIKLLYSREQKNNFISGFGIDFLVEIPFDLNFSKISPNDFIKNILVEKLKIKGVIVGLNFSFGRKKSGNISLLKREGKKYNFFVKVIKSIKYKGFPVSSTSIRKLIYEGKIEIANQMLGRLYSIKGRVVEGEKRGKKIGIPTINLELLNDLVLSEGIYSGYTIIKNRKKKYLSAISIGKNPTFKGKKIVVESHLIDFSEDIYGKEVEIFFYNKIRKQKRFKSVEELVENINRDIAYVKKIKGKVLGENIEKG